MPEAANVHASAVLTGATAVLIRGPSGSGKSRLAFALIEAGTTCAPFGALRFARLVGDDRVMLETASGRLLARPAPALAGLIEIRGLGLRRLPYEAAATIGLVVDLASPDGARLPDAAAGTTEILGVSLPRLALPAGVDPVAPVLAALRTAPGPD